MSNRFLAVRRNFLQEFEGVVGVSVNNVHTNGRIHMVLEHTEMLHTEFWDVLQADHGLRALSHVIES